MKRSHLYFLLTSVFVLGSCTPPPGWKNNSYLYSSGNFNRLKSSKTVRVKLFAGRSEKIAASSFTFRRGKGPSIRGRKSMVAREEGEFIPADGKFIFRKKKYQGTLRVVNHKGKLLFINHVNMNEYLVSVVGHEMSISWELEALKAQSVVARTYLVQRMKENADGPYDVDGTTNHQVYKGVIKNDKKLREVVSRTADEILTYRGKLAQVFFYSSCGGRTAAASEVWSTDYPYLKSQKSHYCQLAPVYKWSAKVPRNKFAYIVGARTVRGVKVKERSPSKRVKEIIILTEKGQKILSGAEVRKKLGARNIKSTLFGMRVSGSYVEIAGRGYGHGVGLCQWGSKFMAAKKHQRYQSILKHFFPGTSLSKLKRKYMI